MHDSHMARRSSRELTTLDHYPFRLEVPPMDSQPRPTDIGNPNSSHWNVLLARIPLCLPDHFDTASILLISSAAAQTKKLMHPNMIIKDTTLVACSAAKKSE
jgi:hypothetical protein